VTVNPLLALLALGLVTVALLGAGWAACHGMTTLYVGIFRGPELGWPRGVQEEEPVAWDWNAAARASTDAIAPHESAGVSPPLVGDLPPALARGADRAATAGAYEVESTRVSPRPVRPRR
jgi:hypothetical protein